MKMMTSIWERYYPPFAGPSCDGVQYGDLSAECTGIAVTCFASVDVIQKAAECGCNFILCHEPLFWGQEISPELKGNPVFQKKAQLLDTGRITVFRDHDRAHAANGRPDWIEDGIADGLGWTEYRIDRPEHVVGTIYEIPPMTLDRLSRHVTLSLNLNGVRLIGDRDRLVRRVWHCAHLLPPPLFIDSDPINVMLRYDIDVLLPLDTVDWTALAFVRDAAALGMRCGAVLAGHFNMEELGMKYMAGRLAAELALPELPVVFLQSGDSFEYWVR